MFDAFQAMVEQDQKDRYLKNLDRDTAGDDARNKKRGSIVQGLKRLAPFRKEDDAPSSSLGDLIDLAFQEEMEIPQPGSGVERIQLELQKVCSKINKSRIFSSLVIITIMVAGVNIGVDADDSQHCFRREWRLRHIEKSHSNPGQHWCDSKFSRTSWISDSTLAVFTCEAAIKILAEGPDPMAYFRDRKNGWWNCLDFFV